MTRKYRPHVDPALRLVTVECPCCGATFDTSESGPFEFHRCSVCHHTWKEVFLREVVDPGAAHYMTRAREEHPNLDGHTHYLIFALRALINNIQRRLKPIPCATPGCAQKLERIEHLLAQILAGGWPSTGCPPILCPACARKRSQGAP